MARPNHQIRQPTPQQNFTVTHPRNIPQGLHHARGPRHAQPRNVVNRNNQGNHQGNIPTHINVIPNEPGNAGQSLIYTPQHVNVNGPRPPMFITGQVTSNIHSGHNNLQQAPMYSVNNQIPQIPYSPQQNTSAQSQQQYFAGYPTPIMVPHNIYPMRSHHPQMTPYCLTTQLQPQFTGNNQINITHPPNVPTHQVVCRGNDILPQVTHSQPNMNPSTIPVQSNNNANPQKRLKARPNALMNIIDPATGRNIAEDIYSSAASPPVKIEKPSCIRITHPNPPQNNKPPKVFPKLTIMVSPSSTLSTTMTSSHSESLSPIPVSTSSRTNSPEKSDDINSNPENRVSFKNEAENSEPAVERSDCNESLVINSNSHCHNNRPLTSVPEEHSVQLQADSQINTQSCHQEGGLKQTKEPTDAVEKSTEEQKPEAVVSLAVAGPSKVNMSKSQRKKSKRKTKNRDLNRNQVQNSSTSSEESTTNARVESSKQNLKVTKPTVIPELKEEEPLKKEEEEECQKTNVCDQNNVKEETNIENKPIIKDEPSIKEEPNLKSEPENHDQSTIKVEVEQPIADQQIQDSQALELPKEKSLASNEVKTETCDIKIKVFSQENLAVSEEKDVQEAFSSQETAKSINIIDINNGPIQISGDSFPLTTDSCVINDGSDQCYIRAASGINFFFSEMSEEGVQLNQNQLLEQQINAQIEVENQENIEIIPEPQKEVEVQQEPQENIEIEIQHEINNKANSEQQKDNSIKQKESDCKELAQEQPVIHRIDECPEPHNHNHDEEQNNVEDKQDEKPNDDKIPKIIKIEETEKQFIKPPIHENDRKSLNDVSELKIYSREFLMEIKDSEICWVRPKLPNVNIVKSDMMRPSRTSSAAISAREKDHVFLFPSFSRPSLNAKPAPMNRRSFQGKSKPQKQMIHVSLSLNETIKLRQAENAWKPSLLQKVKSNEETNEDIVLCNKVRSILNKLTPEKFNVLVNQIKQLEINSLDQLKKVIDILFQKAIDEPLYSSYYALMCKELADKTIQDCTDPSGQNIPENKQKKTKNFIALVLESCQGEFLKHLNDKDEPNEEAQKTKLSNNDEKKEKNSQSEIEEESSKTKRRSLGNIKFVGELFKQKMINADAMLGCIQSLVNHHDEERLESLCKLLITIGQLLDQKNSLEPYFESLKKLTHKDKKNKLSSRIRFMIQDVIELRNNKWVPRKKENNPKTMGQIQKEVENERAIDPMLSVPSQSYSSNKDFSSRRDDRNSNNDRRRNGSQGSYDADENGWNSVRSHRNRPSALSIEISKLKVKPPPAEETTLGSRSSFIFKQATENKSIKLAPNQYASLENMKNRRSSIASSDPPREFRPECKFSTDYSSSRWENQRMSFGPMPTRESLLNAQSTLSLSRTPTPSSLSSPTFTPISRTPTPPTPSVSTDKKSTDPATESKLKNLVKSLIDESGSSDVNLFIKNARETIEDKFTPQFYPLLMEEALNAVLERNQVERQRFSALLAQLIKDNIIPLSVFQAEFKQLLEIANDLVIDIPLCWEYFAEILTEMVAIDAHPFIELTRTLAILKSSGTCGKLLGKLLSILAKEKTPKWVIDHWNESGLELKDLLNSDREKTNDILKEYNLEFLVGGVDSNSKKLSENKMTLEQISEYLLKLLGENDFDNITSWISLNVGEQSEKPQFVRCLVTNILKTSIEAIDQSWRLKSDTFCKLLPLITRYVDAKRDRELQCLYAIQLYNHELLYPQGVLSKIIDHLCDQAVLSDEAFIEWYKIENPNERNGHGVAIKTLTSFFTKLREAERDDSSE